MNGAARKVLTTMPKPPADEFERIERYFSPLSQAAPGALELKDDAALLTPPAGRQLVFTADAMVAGVHFLPDDDAGEIARKLLRVNLSDLAAMAAEPLGYLLTAAWPSGTEETWIARFAAGLSQDQRLFGIDLLGGDTVRTDGPLTLSLTAIGSVPAGQALLRSGAGQGDGIFLSGSIGDGALGLDLLQGRLGGLNEQQSDYLAARYRLPEPRLALGRALRGLATAAIDISDGLLADLGHLLRASGQGAEIERALIPLSEPAARAVSGDPDNWQRILAGGDDYELLFTAPAQFDRAAVAAALDLRLTRVGRIIGDEGLRLLGDDGEILRPEIKGYRHF